MATCLISAGYSVDCKDQLGGIKYVYFTSDYNDNCRASATFDGTDTNKITELGLSEWTIYGTPTSSKVQIYKYGLGQGLSSATVNAVSDPATGTTYFEQTLSLSLKKITMATANQLKLIAYSKPQVFVVDMNDNVMMFGFDNGMDVTGGTLVTGAGKGDMTGFTLELRAEEKDACFFMNSDGVGETGYPFDNVTDYTDFDID